MARLIKTGSPGKDKVLLEKGIVLAIRELAKQQSLDENTRDLLSYIALSLKSIAETIDESVAAWEKRGYWVKADRYRMEWNWAGRIGDQMKQALYNEEWADIAQLTGQVTQKLSSVKIGQRSRMGSPWNGAYQKLISSTKTIVK